MGRSPCCEKSGVKKGPWTAEEDEKLIAYIRQHGHGSWRALPQQAGLLRCGKSCRLRWINYLRPDIKRGKFSREEEEIILQLHALLGNRWSAIASHLPGRTDNEIKNFWNTHMKKRLLQMGIDPVTHQRRADLQWKCGGGLVHMAQWEEARQEAEARLARDYCLTKFDRTVKQSAFLVSEAALVSLPSTLSSSSPLLLLGQPQSVLQTPITMQAQSLPALFATENEEANDVPLPPPRTAYLQSSWNNPPPSLDSELDSIINATNSNSNGNGNSSNCDYLGSMIRMIYQTFPNGEPQCI